MSVLDTFVLLFTGDSKGAVKAADDASHATDKVTHSMEGADHATKHFHESFVELSERIAEKLTIYHLFESGLEFLKSTFEQTVAIQHFSDAIGANVEEVSAWSNAVKASGGSAESFQESLKALTRGLAQGDATGTSRLKPFFTELGINVKKGQDAFDLLLQLADKFHGIGKQQSFGIGTRLGLDEGLIMLLQKGRVEVEKTLQVQKDFGVVTEKQGKAFEELHKHLITVHIIMQDVFRIIGGYLIPIFDKLVDAVVNSVHWFDTHNEIVNDVSESILYLAGAITVALIPALIRLGETAVAAIIRIGAALLPVLIPFLLIAAGIALVAGAIYLVVNDFNTFRRGGQSVVGAVIGYFKNLEDEVVSVFKNIGDWIDHAFDKLKSFITHIPGMAHAFDDVELGDNITKAQSSLAFAAATPLGSQTSSSVFNNQAGGTRSTQVNVDSINISTQATDPQVVAHAVNGVLTKGDLHYAISGADDGIGM